MRPSFYKKKYIVKKISIFLTSCFFLNSCTFNNNTSLKADFEISPDDRIWMTKFFKDVFLDQSAIFTLWGSKPMTFMDCHSYTKEEMQAWDAWIEKLSSDEKKSLVYHAEVYNLPENWEKWEKISSKYPIKKYLFFKNSSFWNPKTELIYFIDVLQTAFTLKQHHETFYDITDIEFDDLDIVFEVQDQNSEFWGRVFKSPVLTGILLGFGEKNAWCFEWAYGCVNEHTSQVALNFRDTITSRNSTEKFYYGTSPSKPLKITINHFPIPAFASYYPDGMDPFIKKYENERKEIQKTYQRQDFLECTLNRLMH
jgi:hypothetical protein